MIDRPSFLVSAGVHLLFLLILFVGLPSFKKEITSAKAISVSLVPIDRLTQSPSRASKKIPTLSAYKKPTYTMGKPLSSKQKSPPRKHPAPLPVKTQTVQQKTVDLKLASKPVLKTELPAEESTRKEKPSASKPNIKKAKDPFDSVLQSVQEFEQEPTSNQKTTDERAFDTDLISSKISLSELDALRQQLQLCWLVPPNVMAEKDLVVEASVDLDVRGVVTDIQILNQREGQKFRSFREAVQSVRQALRAPECTPLKLPPDKYHQWKRCVLRFSSKGIG